MIQFFLSPSLQIILRSFPAILYCLCACSSPDKTVTIPAASPDESILADTIIDRHRLIVGLSNSDSIRQYVIPPLRQQMKELPAVLFVNYITGNDIARNVLPVDAGEAIVNTIFYPRANETTATHFYRLDREVWLGTFAYANGSRLYGIHIVDGKPIFMKCVTGSARFPDQYSLYAEIGFFVDVVSRQVVVLHEKRAGTGYGKYSVGVWQVRNGQLAYIRSITLPEDAPTGNLDKMARLLLKEIRK